MAPIHRVAIIQLHPIPLSPSQNFSKAASFIRSAALQGAKLAVLPEYHLTNWVPEDAKFAECCGEWEVYLEKYQELARELGICIVPGTIVERHWEDEDEQGDGAGKKEGQRKWRLENVAYFIDDKGVVVGKYVKKNLWYVFFLYLNLWQLIIMRVLTCLSFHGCYVSLVICFFMASFHFVISGETTHSDHLTSGDPSNADISNPPLMTLTRYSTRL